MKIIVVFISAITLAIGIARSAVSPSTRPSAQPVATPPAAHLSATLPTSTGTERLRFKVNIGGQPTDMCVVVCVSKKVGAMSGRVPTMFYLGGLGDHGFQGNGVIRNGPPVEMIRRPYLNESIPMMVVAPECPPRFRWEQPVMVQAMVELLKIVAADPRVDPDRLYLNGFSNGAIGAWAIATEAPSYFAAICAIAGKPYEPDKSAQATKDVPQWIIVGSNDGVFTAGSRAMAAALQKAGGNVIISEQPGVAHSSWETMYPKQEFYDWFMSYTRGKPPTRVYTQGELDAIAQAPVIDPVAAKAKKDFAQFAPYWQLSNFSHDGAPGLRDEFNGHKEVFTAKPLNGAVDCIMETTWKIPTDKHAVLSLVVGREPKSDWKLSVRVDGHDEISLLIDKTSAPDGWYQKDIDLSPWSGKDVHMDVFTEPGTGGPAPAYFGKLAVEEN